MNDNNEPIRILENVDYPAVQDINRYLAYCENVRNMSKLTLDSKRHVYESLLQTTRITDLRALDNKKVNFWMTKMKEHGVSPHTINIRVAHIKALVKYYRDMDEINIPLKVSLLIKMKEGSIRRNFYTRKQIMRVLKYADEMTWLLIRISFDAGLRIHELSNLSVNNIQGRRLKFIGKGSKPREAYITEETYTRLIRWIAKNHITDKLWWNSDMEKPYNDDTIRRKMRKTFLRAGFKDFYPHALRHSFATDAQRRGASILELKELLGHSNVETTQRYIHGLDGQLETLFDLYR